MSIRAAWNRFFGDPAWFKKTALGSVIAFLPYVGSVAQLGFMMRHARDVAWGGGETLPKWGDFDKHLKTGFFGFLASLVYTLPLSAAFGVVISAIVVAGVASTVDSGEPTFILPLIIAVAVMMLVLVVVGSFLWVIIVHMALYDTAKSGFELKVIWRTAQANSREFGRAWGRALLLSLASSTVVYLILGVVLGGYALAVFANGSETAIAAGMMGFYPLEFLSLFLTMLVSFPVAMMSADIWGQYARIAYSLDAVGAAEAS